MDDQQLINLAYKEDIPDGDITTDNLGVADEVVKARLIAKEDLILSGKELFTKCLHTWDVEAQLKWYFNNGEVILNGQTVCLITCHNQKLLKAERVALNFIGHFSGIASLTSAFVRGTEGTQTKILDTRKTMPLMRKHEKKAVIHGGGSNHRMSLSDAVMIKDNHIDIAGSITNAVKQIRAKTSAAIEVECSNLDQVLEAIKLPIQRIMLDNMSTNTMQTCLQHIPSSIETEASGNMTVERVPEVAATGVNFISVGSMTHSAPQADFSLRIERDN